MTANLGFAAGFEHVMLRRYGGMDEECTQGVGGCERLLGANRQDVGGKVRGKRLSQRKLGKSLGTRLGRREEKNTVNF